jgi:hypothetical protein
MRLRRVAGTLCAVAASSFAAMAVSAKQPAKSPELDNDRPMQVYLVRSAVPGCEPNCAEWVAAQGRIDNTTPSKFKRLLSKIAKRKLPVLINSSGGSVDDSFAVARMIRAKGLDVAVSKTAIVPCSPKDKACLKSLAEGTARGKPAGFHSICASACAFVLAGGVRRYSGLQTLVGVHRLTTFETRFKVLRTYRVETRKGWFGGPGETKKTLISEKRIGEKTVETSTKKSSYQKVTTFFAEMGVTEKIMPMLMSAPATSIHWLSGRELRETHMATDFIDGEQLIMGALPVDLQGFANLPGHKEAPALEADRLDSAAAAEPAIGHAASSRAR